MSFIYHCRQLTSVEPLTGDDWGTVDEFGHLIRDPDNLDEPGAPVLLDREPDDVPGTEGGCFGTGSGKLRIIPQCCCSFLARQQKLSHKVSHTLMYVTTNIYIYFKFKPWVFFV